MKKKGMVVGFGLVAVATLGGWILGQGTGSEKISATTPALTTTASKHTTGAATTYSSTVSSTVTVVEKPVNASAGVEEPIQIEESGMQVEELVAGDFSSVAGTWTNSGGHVITFSEDGLVSGGGEITGLGASGYGTAKGHYVLKPIGGGVVEFIPAGILIKDYSYDQDGEEVVVSDASDSQVDRIWMGQDLTMVTDVASFYYRVE